jgi:pimeloyl-ACP methyl ester carboxylesterase
VFINVNDVTLKVRDTGTGEPVVLLHGWPDTGDSWRHQTPTANDLALTEEQMTGSTAYVAGPWRYERLDGVGHWMQLEEPDAVNALLLDFLDQHRSLAAAARTTPGP